MEAKIKKNNEIKLAVVNYGKNREYFELYKKSGHSKEVKHQYRVELMIYDNAKKSFKELEGSGIPKIINLKKEY